MAAGAMWAAVVLCLGTAAPSLHTAFSAECTHQFDWFSVGLFYSHRLAGQPGPITRLLACTEEALRTYRGLDIGPTFVHPNLREHPLVAEKGYPSYNKPGSLMFWLDSARAPRETYIFFVDADMMLRQPVDAHALGASRGTVVSAEYTYLVGTDTGFAARFIRSSILHRQAQVGGFHILHREDVRRICPKWFDFTRRVRAFAAEHPDEFFAESMHLKTEEEADQGLRAVRHKQAKWHSEMYGYVFAAAEEGMRHVVVRDLMLYPGYVPYLNRPPTLLHYGADYKVARVPAAPGEPEDIRPPEGHAIHSEDFYFNKMSHTQFDISSCPSKLPFGTPPPIRGVPHGQADEVLRSKRDLVCIEHVRMLNAAMCEYIRAHCDQPGWPTECSTMSAAEHDRAVLEAREAFSRSCVDLHPECRRWATRGECQKNAGYMMSTCAVSCESCTGPPTELLVKQTAGIGNWTEPDFALPEAGAPLDAGLSVDELLRAARLSRDVVTIDPQLRAGAGVKQGEAVAAAPSADDAEDEIAAEVAAAGAAEEAAAEAAEAIAAEPEADADAGADADEPAEAQPADGSAEASRRRGRRGREGGSAAGSAGIEWHWIVVAFLIAIGFVPVVRMYLCPRPPRHPRGRKARDSGFGSKAGEEEPGGYKSV